METTGEHVILNGHRMSVRRAHSIMFVRCSVLGKEYDMNYRASPPEVTIHGYEPDENDLKPDLDEAPAGTVPEMTRSRRAEAGKCNDCGGKK